MNPRLKARLVDASALAGLAAIVLVFFWKIALTNQVLAGIDVFAYFYPYRDYVSEALRAGRLPLWNPYLFMGAPLLANSQAAVLYPLHWPLIGLSPPKQIAWSIVLHVWLAGAGTYLFVRRGSSWGRLPAFAAALVFALGGFLGAQAEHVNQLNSSAWLPWLLLWIREALAGHRLALLAGGCTAALIVLAGHTQAAYIVLTASAVYSLLVCIPEWRDHRGLRRLSALRGLAALAVMVIVGLALSAVQLLPTLELSRLSVRSEGLPYREAASFSLSPALLHKAFLPPLLWEAPFSEFVAYIGITGLVLAGYGLFRTLRPRRQEVASHGTSTEQSLGVISCWLAALGVFLAFGAYNPAYYLLYKLVPGFGLFRVPARWLLLYAFGSALLAGLGLQHLSKARRWRVFLLSLLVLELLTARRQLASSNPTAPAAFDSMRSAPAHLLSEADAEPSRFLSLSDITYDPGDLADLRSAYTPYLSAKAIYDLIVASKMKEVLAFNLPLRYRLYSVDGYDGGLLPTARYVSLERLFVSPEEIWPDGRLRQQLRAIPSAQLLALLNVRYVITDKLQDVWVDDVYYDLEHTVSLGSVRLTTLPEFQATHLGVVTYLTGTAGLADGTPVARVSLTPEQGASITLTLLAGKDTAEGLYVPGPVAHARARAIHAWKDNPTGSDYLSVLDLGYAVRPQSIEIMSLLDDPNARVILRGMTLIDGRTKTSRSVSVDPVFRQVHSGDVKIYENLSALPRAFVVHRARVLSDDEALAALRDPSFEPASEVILAAGRPLAGSTAASTVEQITYEPELIEYQVSLEREGYLVLTDAYYPGWRAWVDEQPASLIRADVYFRAVALEPGMHRVVFRYMPSSVQAGQIASGVTLAGCLLASAALAIRAGRNRRNRV